MRWILLYERIIILLLHRVSSTTPNIWHQRLGHPSSLKFQHILRSLQLPGALWVLLVMDRASCVTNENKQEVRTCPGVLADVVPPSPETPAICESVLRNPKCKRGPTKLKTIAIDGHCRVGVLFDDNGQPIGEGSVKLSSFLGALDLEIVPYALSDWRRLPCGMAKVLWQSIKVRFKLDQEWEREQVFEQMAKFGEPPSQD